MSYLVIVLFALNNQMAHIYLGETNTEAECVKQARESIPKVLPDLKNGMILCVKKVST